MSRSPTDAFRLAPGRGTRARGFDSLPAPPRTSGRLQSLSLTGAACPRNPEKNRFSTGCQVNCAERYRTQRGWTRQPANWFASSLYTAERLFADVRPARYNGPPS